jgi:beta-N-acetylhexosaminidase
MTAHIRYNAIDKGQCATLSPKAIHLIRTEIGYDGLLMSDDVSMKALKGDFETLSRDILEAGCDVVLHCNGKMEEMLPVAKGARIMDAEAQRRMKNAWETLPKQDSASAKYLLAEFNDLYEKTSAVA